MASSSLTGRVALVTGSTSGIGLEIATKLAHSGYNLILNGFGDADAVNSTCDRLRKSSGMKVDYQGADMAIPGEIEAMINNVSATHNGIDVLVNNAGIQHMAPVEDFPPAMWDKIMAINLNSVFHTTRLCLPFMKERGWGRVVNISSVHGLVGSKNKAAYVTAKHGVIGFTKAVALESATTGVTVNAVCPGWVLTPLVQAQIDERARVMGTSAEEARTGLLQEKQPSLQFAKQSQVAELVGFLCSDAAEQVQGVAWQMDGGWTAQ